VPDQNFVAAARRLFPALSGLLTTFAGMVVCHIRATLAENRFSIGTFSVEYRLRTVVAWGHR
jgi:hypothetical protein